MGFGFIGKTGLGIVSTSTIVVTVVTPIEWASEDPVPNLDWTPEAPL